MIYPTLGKIRTFAAVAAQGSFRKASEQLHLSQPALSTHIRDLEQTLGILLFHRTTRSVRLTPEGARFLVHARRALEEIESGIVELRDQAMLQRGRVIIACVPSAACDMLPKVLNSFTKRHPGIQIQVLDGYAETLAQRVVNREADIGLGPFVEHNDDLKFIHVKRDPFIAVFPQNHPLAAYASVQLRELSKFPLLTLAPGTNVRAIVEQAFAKQEMQFRPALEVLHHHTLGGMVEAGIGITILPLTAFAMLGHPQLKTAAIVNPSLSRDVGIMHRRDHAPAPAVKAFLQALEDNVTPCEPAQALPSRRNRKHGKNKQALLSHRRVGNGRPARAAKSEVRAHKGNSWMDALNS